MKKRKTKKNNSQNSQDKIYNKIVKKLLDEDNPYYVLYSFKKNHTIEEIYKNFSKITEHFKLKNLPLNNLIINSEELLYKNPFYHKPMDLWKELIWTALTIDKYKEELKIFYILKNEFETNILLSNLEEAEKNLNLIEQMFGKSTWVIKNRLNLLYSLSGIEKQKEFTQKILDMDTDIILKTLTYWYSISAETNVSFNYFERTMNNFFEEISNKLHVEYYKYKLKKDYLVSEESLSYILVKESTSSIIDIYETFIDILSRTLYMSFDNNDNIDVLRKILRKLNKVLPDPRLINLLRAFETNIQPTENEKDSNILNIYNNMLEEKYLDAFNAIDKVLQLNPNYISLYEPYVISAYESGNTFNFSENTLLYKILNCYNDILNVNDNMNDSVITLLKMAITYPNLSFIGELLAFVNQHLKDDRTCSHPQNLDHF